MARQTFIKKKTKLNKEKRKKDLFFSEATSFCDQIQEIQKLNLSKNEKTFRKAKKTVF